MNGYKLSPQTYEVVEIESRQDCAMIENYFQVLCLTDTRSILTSWNSDLRYFHLLLKQYESVIVYEVGPASNDLIFNTIENNMATLRPAQCTVIFKSTSLNPLITSNQ
ncbi:hypothetical protein KUTeg_021450 [Tegillarca granosa]|uniref:Uncharacterized protein n=1 Tax=Tegillarca granosa TaxID=220873 RepID=A0ABQ9E3B4_TEGGR|nr:hypothetical protein KUTeg_021450 [Tegillarca granosa]